MIAEKHLDCDVRSLGAPGKQEPPDLLDISPVDSHSDFMKYSEAERF